MGVQTHQKKIQQKNHVEIVLQKKSKKQSKTDFLSVLGEGNKKNTTTIPGTFSATATEEPTNHVGVRNP
jgi:hypothetical protein